MAFFSKQKPIITEEDKKELYEIKRKAYMEEARKLIEEKAREQAKNDLGIKPKKDGW